MRACKAILMLAAAGLLLPAAPARAATPIDAARKSLNAMKQGRLEDFAASMHPEALKTFQSLLLKVVEGAEKEGKQAEVLQLFAGPPDTAALKKLTPAQFYVSFLRGVMAKQPRLKELTSKSTYRFLGQVAEGPVMHVVYRLSMNLGGQSLSAPAVISMKKQGTTWGALLTGDIQGLAEVLAQRFGGKKPATEKLQDPVPTVLGQVREGKGRVDVVVRWVTPFSGGRVSRVTAHTIESTDQAWKLLKNRAALQKHLAKNYSPT